MLIDSNFHDYYDCIQKQGVDKRIVYRRFKQLFEIKRDYNFYKEFYPFSCQHSPYILGFCGKIYPIIRSLENTYYSFDEYQPFIEKERARKRWWGLLRHDHEYRRFFSQSNILLDLFDKYRSPIFLWAPTKISINVQLSKFGFQRVFDPYSAYQELSMYMGSILCENEDQISSVNDKDLVTAKGFDKFSFRKEKSE